MGYLEAFWHYCLMTAPYLLLGCFFGGLVHAFLSVNWIKQQLGGEKGSQGIFKAAFWGIPLPLCSCAVIPTAVSLRKAGASKASTSSFLIATPESGVDSISVTYGLMDLPMTIIRPVVGFFAASVSGFAQIFFNHEDGIGVEENSQEDSSCCGSKKQSEESFFERLKRGLKFGFGKLLDDMSSWLLIGITAGAMIEYLIPENFFTTIPAEAARYGLMLLGIPLYICASATTPIAASLVLKGISPGTALILLVLGPATNLSNILVIQKALGKKAVILNIVSISLVTLICSYLVDFAYQSFAWPLDFKLDEHVHAEEALWQQALAVIFLLLIAKGIWKDKLKGKLFPS